MPGSGCKKRQHALAIRCYNLRKEGLTLKEIAEIVNLDKDQINSRIALGERLLSIKE